MSQAVPVVAQVNYLFFHSTRSFIHFYFSRLRRVHPICLTRAPDSRFEEAAVFPDLADDFYPFASRRSPALERVISAGGVTLRRALTRLPARLAGPALNVLHDRLLPRVRSDADPDRFLDWAEQILRRRDARLIHAYFAPVAWRMLGLKRLLRVPLVVTFLGDDVGSFLDSWWWWWIQLGPGAPDWPKRRAELFAEGDLFLVEGPFMRQRLIDLGCPPDKVAVQRIAIPVGEMAPREPRERAADKTIIVFAGRFCEQKGVLYALEAVREIWAERHDLEFRLIGDETLTDGRYAARIYDYVRQHRLQECVRFLGFLDYADYLKEMSRGDVFLAPSVVGERGESEGGAPTTILEAQALGIPVISTRHCDIPNVTRPGESALLVPERDPALLALALRALLDDRPRRQRMGDAGRLHIERHHDIEKEAPVLEQRYLELIERARHAQAG